MTNTSILSAFERLWQHIVAALASKQDVITGTADQFVVIGSDGKPTVKTVLNAEEVSF